MRGLGNTVGMVMGALVLLSASAPAQATVVRRLTIDEQVAQSDLVVEGTVGTSTGAIHPRFGRPVTDTSIIVRRIHKGPDVREVTVRQLGGMWQGSRQRVMGDGELVAGSEVVLFLRRDRAGLWYLNALALSVYHVEPITGDPEVRRQLGELRMSGEEPPPEPRTLSELRAAIRAAMERHP